MMRLTELISTLACLVLVATACILTPNIPTASPTYQRLEGKTAAPTNSPREDTATILEQLGGYPCPDSAFTCIKLSVPLDHFNSSNSKTIDVVFAVLPATSERKGMFVTANGGPGASGLMAADSYTSYLEPALTEHFDIVFYDQRGVGASGGLQCPQAAVAYYLTEADTTTPEGKATLTAAAQTFAHDCVTEMGNLELLPYLSTVQAVEDLEAFRQVMGDDTFWLYGESYGTQFSQTYAAVHPDHLAGLILDGTVDLTLSGTDFLAEQAAAFDNALTMTLQACNSNPVCAEAMGGDAVVTYDKLAAKLKSAPQPFNFPLPSEGMAERTFSFGDLESAAASYLYSESERMIFLRALAAYTRNGDMAPMARVLYDALSIDPETLVGIADPSYSDGVYYSVECQDYGYFSGTPTERAKAYLRAGDQVDASLKRFSSIFYGDFPCVFWPTASQDQTRPAYLTFGNVPTLVLGATADPATPLSNGLSVYQHLADGYMVTEMGGPHVIFGWGHAFPDDLVTAYLVDGTLPDQRETTCDGVVTSEYVPLSPLNAADFENPLKAMEATYTEIYYLPEYYYWDGTTPTTTGCPFSGTMTFAPSDSGEAFTLVECAFSEGFVMTGTGAHNYDEDTFSLDVNVTGLAEGPLHYLRQSDGSIQVTGKYGNQTIDLKDTGQ
jgi:pimeloyl-ACP methyl ester carboxylesterase